MTTAELEVGTGCSEADLKKVELIVEQADFSRQSMFVDNREFARLEKDGCRIREIRIALDSWGSCKGRASQDGW